MVRRFDTGTGTSATTGAAGGVSTAVLLDVVVTETAGGASDGSYPVPIGVATSAAGAA